MKEGRRKRLKMQKMQLALTNLATRKRRVLNLACPLVLLITQRNITISRPVHTCHRLKRDIGWVGGMLATPIQRQDS